MGVFGPPFVIALGAQLSFRIAPGQVKAGVSGSSGSAAFRATTRHGHAASGIARR